MLTLINPGKEKNKKLALTLIGIALFFSFISFLIVLARNIG